MRGAWLSQLSASTQRSRPIISYRSVLLLGRHGPVVDWYFPSIEEQQQHEVVTGQGGCQCPSSTVVP